MRQAIKKSYSYVARNMEIFMCWVKYLLSFKLLCWRLGTRRPFSAKNRKRYSSIDVNRPLQLFCEITVQVQIVDMDELLMDLKWIPFRWPDDIVLSRDIVDGSSEPEVTCFNCHYRALFKLPSPKTCAKHTESDHKCVYVCFRKNRLPSTAWPKCTIQWNKLSIPPATCTCGQHADFDFANSVHTRNAM